MGLEVDTIRHCHRSVQHYQLFDAETSMIERRRRGDIRNVRNHDGVRPETCNRVQGHRDLHLLAKGISCQGNTEFIFRRGRPNADGNVRIGAVRGCRRGEIGSSGERLTTEVENRVRLFLGTDHAKVASQQLLAREEILRGTQPLPLHFHAEPDFIFLRSCGLVRSITQTPIESLSLTHSLT